MDFEETDSEAGKRRELKISGEILSRFLDENGGVPKTLFMKYSGLNFVELSESPLLKYLPNEVSSLSALTNLVLQGNQLEKLPKTVGDLKKLKFLDVSRNALVELPSTIGGCSELQTLLVANNKLGELPASLNSCEHLSRLDASHNALKAFPVVLPKQLADVSLKGNSIIDIPANISELTSLKSLDLSDNKILVVPGELGDCSKLRNLQLGGNELADRRLRKLIDDGVQKAILDYVKKKCARTTSKKEPKSAKGTTEKNTKTAQEGNEKQMDSGDEGQCQPKDKISVMPSRSDAKIIWRKEVAEIRPYVLFCIIWDVDFTETKALKEFLALQNKMHENQCHRRVAATIATHDLAKIRFPIAYIAKAPEEITIHPLGRPTVCTANELVSKLTAEAEQLRKEKKRHVYSGVHQYLYLVKDKPKYACLCDADNVVISFPPITNSDLTKITSSTKDVLLEVTSDKDLAACKRVMEALVKAIFTSSLIRSGDSTGKSMLIEQVKVENEDGTTRSAYPSKVDLGDLGGNIAVVREWETEESV